MLNTRHIFRKKHESELVSKHNRLIAIIIFTSRHVSQQNIIRRRPPMIPHPLRLHTKENPHPPPKHLQHLHGENPALEIVEMVQMRAELQAPCTPQHGVHHDRAVVEFLGVEPPVAAQAPGVLGIVAFLWRGEEAEVPVARDVPVEAIAGIHNNSAHPHSKKRSFRDAKGGGVAGALERAEDDDGEGGGVLQCVGEVRAAPACCGVYLAGALVGFLHAHVFCYALAQADQVGNGDDEGDHEGAAAVAVGRAGGAVRAVEEHAEADEEVAEYFCIARERIGEENVAEFPVCGFGDAPDAYAFEGCEGSAAAVAGDEGYGGDEADYEDEEVEVWQDLPAGDVDGGAAGCDNPEEEQREGEGYREEGSDAVAG